MASKKVNKNLSLDVSSISLGSMDAHAPATKASGIPSWARWVPGPSPNYRFQGLPTTLSNVGVIVCGCCIFLLSGYNVALMGSVSSNAGYLHQVNLTGDYSQTQLLIGVINSIYWVGVMIGALIIGYFSDFVGRRRAIVSAGILAIAVIPIFAALQSFSWAIALRFINGFATGAFDSVGLNWSAETIDHRHRGRAIGIELCCAAIGASISYFMVYRLSDNTSSTVSWRLPLAFQLIFVLLVLSLVCFLPESPRWLIKVGMDEAAREVLFAIKPGSDTSQRSAAIEQEITNISLALEEEKIHDSSAGYWDMFTACDDMKTARRTGSALIVQFATQAMIGAGFVSGYGIKIFETGGWSANLAALLSGFAILTQAVFGIAGAMISDRIGRRKAMVSGALVGSILLAFLGMCGYFVDRYSESDKERAKVYGTITVALVFVWCAQFGMTWLWCPFVYPSEIFPARCRAKGSSIGIVGFSSGSFFTNMISTYLFSAVGYGSLFLICGLSMVMAIVCFLFMPETAGKTLEEIDHLFDES